MANAYRMNKLSYLAHSEKTRRSRRTKHTPKTSSNEQEVSEGSGSAKNINAAKSITNIVNNAVEQGRNAMAKKGLNRVSGKGSSASSFIKGASDDIKSVNGTKKPLKTSKIKNANANTLETKNREKQELKTRTSNGFKVYQVDIRNGQRYYVYMGTYSEYEKIPDNVRRIVEMGNVKSAKYAITYDYQGHSTRIFRKP